MYVHPARKRSRAFAFFTAVLLCNHSHVVSTAQTTETRYGTRASCSSAFLTSWTGTKTQYSAWPESFEALANFGPTGRRTCSAGALCSFEASGCQSRFNWLWSAAGLTAHSSCTEYYPCRLTAPLTTRSGCPHQRSLLANTSELK